MKKIVDIEMTVGAVWLLFEDDEYPFDCTLSDLLRDLLKNGLFVSDEYMGPTTLEIAVEPEK